MILSDMNLHHRQALVADRAARISDPKRCCFFFSISRAGENIDRTGHRPICMRRFLPYAWLPDLVEMSAIPPVMKTGRPVVPVPGDLQCVSTSVTVLD